MHRVIRQKFYMLAMLMIANTGIYAEVHDVNLISVTWNNQFWPVAGQISGTGTWQYDDVSNSLTLTGEQTLAIGSSFTLVINGTVLDLTAVSASGAAFSCADDPLAAELNGYGLCGGYDFGPDGDDDSTLDYSTVPGVKTIGGDDVNYQPMRQLSDLASTALLPWDGTALTARSVTTTSGWPSIFSANQSYTLVFSEPTPPTVTINKPVDTETLSVLEAPFALDADASDVEDGDISAGVTWVSDIDGPIASPASLSEGTHVLTASVTDSDGMTGQDSVTVSVGLEVYPINLVTVRRGLPDTSAYQGGASSGIKTADFIPPEANPAGDTFYGVYDARAQKVTVNQSPGSRPTIKFVTEDFLSPGNLYGEDSFREEFPSGDLVWDLQAGQLNYAAYSCADTNRSSGWPNFVLVDDLAHCGNYLYIGGDNNSTMNYGVVPGVRTLGGDDVAFGDPLQGSDYGASLVSWDGSTLELASSDWSSTSGVQLIFAVDTGELPDVVINSPTDGASLFLGQPLPLNATASDPQDGDLTSQVQWSSDVDGLITSMSLLTPGPHMLTAMVTDSDGYSASESVAVSADELSLVINSLPDGSTVAAGVAASFTATALDIAAGDLSGSIAWSSDLDGSLGSGAAISPVLSVGQHTITASVNGPDSRQAMQAIVVNALEPVIPVYMYEVRGGFPAETSVAVFVPVSKSFIGSYNAAQQTVLINQLASTRPDIRFELTDDQLAFGAADRVTESFPQGDVSWDLSTGAISYSAFECEDIHRNVELFAEDHMVHCGNYEFDSADESTVDYSTVPGTRTLGGDDTSLGPMRQGSDYGGLQTSWNGTQLVVESPDWTANASGTSSTDGIRLLFNRDATREPSLSIVTPVNGSVLSAETPVELNAVATDQFAVDLSAQVQWSSDVDGALTPLSTLSPGPHVITARVMDANGFEASSSVNVSAAYAPTLTILAPSPGSRFVQGQTITLRGVASDFEDGDISADIAWSSNLDGALGSGANLGVVLSPGGQTVTATADDSDSATPPAILDVLVYVLADIDANGLSDQWETQYGITDPAADPDGDGLDSIAEQLRGTSPLDAAPTVTIMTPVDGASVESGMSINFSTLAFDTEDGDLSASVQWHSNLDGSIGTGASFSATLTDGAHQISATVTDSTGAGPAYPPAISVVVGITPSDDINGDGVVDISDLLELEQTLIGQ